MLLYKYLFGKENNNVTLKNTQGKQCMVCLIETLSC